MSAKQQPQTVRLLGPDETPIACLVSTPGGEQYTINADLSWSVCQVKEQIERLSGIALQDQQLVCGVTELRDGEKLDAVVVQGRMDQNWKHDGLALTVVRTDAVVTAPPPPVTHVTPLEMLEQIGLSPWLILWFLVLLVQIGILIKFGALFPWVMHYGCIGSSCGSLMFCLSVCLGIEGGHAPGLGALFLGPAAICCFASVCTVVFSFIFEDSSSSSLEVHYVLVGSVLLYAVVPVCVLLYAVVPVLVSELR